MLWHYFASMTDIVERIILFINQVVLDYSVDFSTFFCWWTSNNKLIVVCKIAVPVYFLPGQAAYHFLAGCQDGKFGPAYSEVPSPIHPLELSKALLSQVWTETYLLFSQIQLHANLWSQVTFTWWKNYLCCFICLQLKENEIPSFLIIVKDGGKHITSKLKMSFSLGFQLNLTSGIDDITWVQSQSSKFCGFQIRGLLNWWCDLIR